MATACHKSYQLSIIGGCSTNKSQTWPNHGLLQHRPSPPLPNPPILSLSTSLSDLHASPSFRVTHLPYIAGILFELLNALPSVIHENIEHDEPRVRSLIARVVGSYALMTTGLAAFHHEGEMAGLVEELQVKRRQVHDAILTSLKFHFERKAREEELEGAN